MIGEAALQDALAMVIALLLGYVGGSIPIPRMVGGMAR